MALTNATVSFTGSRILTVGILTTYTLNLDTPQTNNVITFNQNFTDIPLIQLQVYLLVLVNLNIMLRLITEGGANYTLANILNFTTSLPDPPDAPVLVATSISETAIDIVRTAGAK